MLTQENLQKSRRHKMCLFYFFHKIWLYYVNLYALFAEACRNVFERKKDTLTGVLLLLAEEHGIYDGIEIFLSSA